VQLQTKATNPCKFLTLCMQLWLWGSRPILISTPYEW